MMAAANPAPQGQARYTPAVSNAPSLSLDEFATITVRIRGGAKRPRVLAEAGVEDAVWLSAQAYWLGRIASLSAHGDRALHNLFLERTAQLEREGVGEPPTIVSGDSPLAPAPRVAPLRGLAKRRRKERAAAPGGAPASVRGPVVQMKPDLSGTAAGPSPWAGKPKPQEALPFGGARSPGAPEAAAQKQAEQHRPSLPFGQQPSKPREPRQSQQAGAFRAVPEVVGKGLEQTAPAQPSPLVARAGKGGAASDASKEHGGVSSLPFAKADPSTPEVRASTTNEFARPHKSSGTAAMPALTPEMLAALKFSKPEAKPAKDRPVGSGTMAVPMMSPTEIAKMASLPFGGAKAAAAGGGAAPQPQKQPETRQKAYKRRSKKPDVGQAVVVGATLPAEVRAKMQAAMGTADKPKLTLAQFASITAEIVVADGDLDAIYGRYGLDATSYAHEKALWSKAFEAEPSKNEEYIRLMREYRAWLRGQGR